jgi:hypothetical protein
LNLRGMVSLGLGRCQRTRNLGLRGTVSLSEDGVSEDGVSEDGVSEDGIKGLETRDLSVNEARRGRVNLPASKSF